MATTKQIKAANVLNNAFTTSTGGDGVALLSTSATLGGANLANKLATDADLNETSLEQSLIDIAAFTDERGLKIAVRGLKLIIPKELQFTADRILESTLTFRTADNDINATRNMGMLPQGYTVNHYLNDPDAFFIKTDAPNGMKMFQRELVLRLPLKVILIQVTSVTKLVKDIPLVSQILEECLVAKVLNWAGGFCPFPFLEI